MGKVKAIELFDTRVDFISFVEEGANGEKFEIFKSANYKEDKGKETISKEEYSLFKKFTEYFRKFTKENKEEDMDLEKVLEMLTEIVETVKSIDVRLTALEGIAKEKEDGEEGSEEGTEGADGVDKVADTGTEKKEVGDVAKGKDVTEGDDKSEEVEKKLTDTIEKLAKSLEEVNKRLESIEKMRVQSNAIAGDDDTTGDVTKSEFAGIF